MKDVIVIKAEGIANVKQLKEIQQILLKQKEEGLIVLPVGFSLVDRINEDCKIEIEKPEPYRGDCKIETEQLTHYCRECKYFNAFVHSLNGRGCCVRKGDNIDDRIMVGIKQIACIDFKPKE